MSELNDTEILKKLESLAGTLSKIATDATQQIMQLKIENFRISSRFEALLRHLYSKGTVDFVDYSESLVEFQTLNKKIVEINKNQNLVERVKTAIEYNKNSAFKIYGDEVNLLAQIKESGGTSSDTAKLILGNLLCSKTLSDELMKHVVLEAPQDAEGSKVN